MLHYVQSEESRDGDAEQEGSWADGAASGWALRAPIKSRNSPEKVILRTSFEPRELGYLGDRGPSLGAPPAQILPLVPRVSMTVGRVVSLQLKGVGFPLSRVGVSAGGRGGRGVGVPLLDNTHSASGASLQARLRLAHGVLGQSLGPKLG
jgi:hypothetical protein